MDPKEIVPKLLHACPSARLAWEDHRTFWGDEEAGAFNDVAVFARHAVDRFSAGDTREFASLFGLIEEMIASGDSKLAELATVGFIEDLQTLASHQPFGPDVFKAWLGPNSERGWVEVETAWRGKNSLSGVLRAERDKTS